MSEGLPEGKWRTESTRASFRHAADGLYYCLRTQRHMPHYFASMFIVLLSGVFLRLSKLEVLFVFSAVTLVLLAEMLNTAAETIVNTLCPERNDNAKVAKDVAAAAVLVACCYAVSVLVVVYFSSERLASLPSGSFLTREMPPHQIWLIGLVLLGLVIAAAKERGLRGTLLKGGVVSGHAALAFFAATCLFFVMQNKMWAVLGFLLAALVAQSRVEGKIHSVREVVIGAVLGMFLGVVVYMVGPGISPGS